MRKCLLILFFTLFLIQGAISQESKESRDKRMQWWREARFGDQGHRQRYRSQSFRRGKKEDENRGTGLKLPDLTGF